MKPKVAIKVSHLKKYFGEIHAIDDISFEVKKGEIFGFLGPNGAGKTTTINILSTLLKPDGGSVSIDGYDVMLEEEAVRQRIGLVFQESIYDDHLTIEENLYLHSLLYGLNLSQYRHSLREVLKLVELWDRRKFRLRQLSGGMRRRMEIARALIHQPAILFLDEPTIGLDPQTRNKIWDYIFTVRKEKDQTIFLTTQYINEAESCDRIAIIDNGKIIIIDKPSNLKRLVASDIISLRTADNDLASEVIERNWPELRFRRFGRFLEINVENGDEFLPQLIKSMPIKILSVELHQPTLEDVFLKLTGRRIREEIEINGG